MTDLSTTYFTQIQLESITYQAVMGLPEGELDYDLSEDDELRTLLESNAWIFGMGVCHIFAFALFKEFGYKPYKFNSPCHYFCKTTDGRYVDVRGLSDRMVCPGKSEIIGVYEEVDISEIESEIKMNELQAEGYYAFARTIITRFHDVYAS